MPSKAPHWLRQADHDLSVARTMQEAAHYDWSCFAAQQAAEKALKALYQHHHAEGWGHALDLLIEGLLRNEPELAPLRDIAKELDKFYIPTLDPNAHEGRAPADAYTSAEATRAIGYAQDIIAFCQARCGAGPGGAGGGQGLG